MAQPRLHRVLTYATNTHYALVCVNSCFRVEAGENRKALNPDVRMHAIYVSGQESDEQTGAIRDSLPRFVEANPSRITWPVSRSSKSSNIWGAKDMFPDWSRLNRRHFSKIKNPMEEVIHANAHYETPLS